jgi:O-antigen ligase
MGNGFALRRLMRALEKASDNLGNKEPLRGAFFWLTAFYVVYCARPTELVPGLSEIPLAKITGLLAGLSLLLSLGKTPRRFKDLPKEALYLLALILLLFVSALASTVWRGGAFFNALDFSKVYVAWILTFMLIISVRRLRRIIFLQTISVAAVSAAAIIKGHSVPRLSGVIGGFYSNPNDMAFAIVLSLPFCMAFMLSAKNIARKGLWLLAALVMLAALMLTASRAGFIDLVIAGSVGLWHFGVKGKRVYLIVSTLFVGAILLLATGGTLARRFAAISGDTNSLIEESAQGSYEERKLLMVKALEAIEHYPILGVGAGNFIVYSEIWKEVHASYLQIAAEGGIPALILYLLFFSRGFKNLRQLKMLQGLDTESVLFTAALSSSLVGFVVGACFAPEAYQFFPYFTVCYTSVLVAMVKERESSALDLTVAPLRGSGRLLSTRPDGRSGGLIPTF